MVFQQEFFQRSADPHPVFFPDSLPGICLSGTDGCDGPCIFLFRMGNSQMADFFFLFAPGKWIMFPQFQHSSVLVFPADSHDFFQQRCIWFYPAGLHPFCLFLYHHLLPIRFIDLIAVPGFYFDNLIGQFHALYKQLPDLPVNPIYVLSYFRQVHDHRHLVFIHNMDRGCYPA